MSAKVYKKKSFGETPLFRSLTIFMAMLVPMVKNMPKDTKTTIGHAAINAGLETLGLLIKGYHRKDPVKKKKYIEEVVDKVTFLELTIKLLFELKEISENQSANLSIHMADIKTQLAGWQNKLDGNTEENNGKPNE